MVCAVLGLLVSMLTIFSKRKVVVKKARTDMPLLGPGGDNSLGLKKLVLIVNLQISVTLL